MKLLKTVIPLTVLAAATTATVISADARPRWRVVRERHMLHHHRACHMDRHG